MWCSMQTLLPVAVAIVESGALSLLLTSHVFTQWLAPDIVPSTFGEGGPPVESFEDVHEYPVAIATHKAVDVYERLVVSMVV